MPKFLITVLFLHVHTFFLTRAQWRGEIYSFCRCACSAIRLVCVYIHGDQARIQQWRLQIQIHRRGKETHSKRFHQKDQKKSKPKASPNNHLNRESNQTESKIVIRKSDNNKLIHISYTHLTTLYFLFSPLIFPLVHFHRVFYMFYSFIVTLQNHSILTIRYTV